MRSGCADREWPAVRLGAPCRRPFQDGLLRNGALTFFPANKGLGLSGVSEWVGRQGRIGTTTRSSSEFSLGVQATLMR